MRVINLTKSPITFTDLDRGCAGESKGIYLDWNAKCSSVVEGSSGFMDVLDTERVMLSTELGQIKKMKTVGNVVTKHSMTGNVPELFTFAGETFEVVIGSGALQSFTLTGTGITATAVSTIINTTATGFVAERSPYFFRSSFVDNIIDKNIQEGDCGTSSSGERGPSIVSGFLVLVSDNKITIGSGTANAKLGFIAGDFTKAQ